MLRLGGGRPSEFVDRIEHTISATNTDSKQFIISLNAAHAAPSRQAPRRRVQRREAVGSTDGVLEETLAGPALSAPEPGRGLLFLQTSPKISGNLRQTAARAASPVDQKRGEVRSPDRFGGRASVTFESLGSWCLFLDPS